MNKQIDHLQFLVALLATMLDITVDEYAKTVDAADCTNNQIAYWLVSYGQTLCGICQSVDRLAWALELMRED